MPKKKKTRKQKILADKRQKNLKMQSQQIVNPVMDIITEYKTQPRLEQNKQYQYVYSDLIKTVVLTLSIVTGELLLAYFFVWRSII